MDPVDYLGRIGFDGPISHDLDTLTRLQLAHLQAVPFEALDVFVGKPVFTTAEHVLDKIVGRRRGGWCFEVNGAFALLLDALGFEVKRLAAAVLLNGPTEIVDHLVLEVQLDQAYLVEVGFGDRAPIVPLPLGAAGPLDSLGDTFEFIASPQGTTLAQVVDGVPEARYRFKRVAHELADFEPASRRLQQDRTMHWSTSPFATRLVDDRGTRIILTRGELKTLRGRDVERRSVTPDEWNDVLADRFGLRVPRPLTPGELCKQA